MCYIGGVTLRDARDSPLDNTIQMKLKILVRKTIVVG